MSNEQKITIKVEADTNQAKNEMKKLGFEAENMQNSVNNTLKDLILKGADAEQTFKNLALEISRKFRDASLIPLKTNHGDFVDILNQLLPSEKGNILNQGTIQPFAAGGIVNSPTIFPLANSKQGLMGEAGPEAILPLTRGSDGKLGVATNNNKQNININFNVTAQDSDSFMKSESQISAMMSRMSQRGFRNL